MPRDSFGAWPPSHALYPFRYRDRLTGKWVRARYVAELGVIASQYQEWEITGAPEIRSGGGRFVQSVANLTA